MRVPVPNNRLVAFTLAGAVLTAVVAGALAVPGSGLAQIGDQAGPADSDASRQSAGDGPTPTQDFTPAVRTQSDYGERKHEAEYEDEDDEAEYENEDEDHEAAEYEDEDDGLEDEHEDAEHEAAEDGGDEAEYEHEGAEHDAAE